MTRAVVWHAVATLSGMLCLAWSRVVQGLKVSVQGGSVDTDPLAMTFLGLPCASIWCAASIFSAVITRGLPPLWPLARAAVSPTAVRSRIRSCWKASSMAKIRSWGRPTGGVVSISSVSEMNPHSP